jgi:hypothetical protein
MIEPVCTELDDASILSDDMARVSRFDAGCPLGGFSARCLAWPEETET